MAEEAKNWKVRVRKKFDPASRKTFHIAQLKHTNGTIHTISWVPHETESAAKHEAREKLKQWLNEDMGTGAVAPTNSVAAAGVAGITGEPPVDNRKHKPNHLRRKATKTLKELREQWTSSHKTD